MLKQAGEGAPDKVVRNKAIPPISHKKYPTVVGLLTEINR
jgi:hypothetical protein